MKSKKSDIEITKDTTLAEILKQPKAEAILARYNLPCLHCPLASYEMGTLKIGDVAKRMALTLTTCLGT